MASMSRRISTIVSSSALRVKSWQMCSPSPTIWMGFTICCNESRIAPHTQDKIKVGLEATGHYSYNLLGFLLDNGLSTYVLNPLRTNLYRKSLSLRKTKTDRVDARTIASMLLSDAGLKPYTDTAYHNEELKSLTRYRFDKVKERAKAEKLYLQTGLHPVPGTGKAGSFSASCFCLRSAGGVPRRQTGCRGAHLTRLKTLLETASKGRYKRDMALEIRRRCQKLYRLPDACQVP